MPRLTPRAAGAVLVLLVVVSAALRLGAARAIPGPFIAPDEMVYSLLGRSLWSDGSLSILGADIGFYSLLYPAFVGLPLSVGSLRTGFELLQAVQAVVRYDPVSVWGGLYRYLLENPATLVVTNTRSWTGLRRLVFGSVAATIVRHSPSPVLVVPRAEGGGAG